MRTIPETTTTSAPAQVSPCLANAPGSITITNNWFALFVRRVILAGTQRVTIQGNGVLRIM